MPLNEKQEALCTASQWDFSDLKALFLNCTLKRSPEQSHTQGLIDISKAILEKNGVRVEVLRPVDYELAFGVWPDMKEHGWELDEWPEILEKVMAEIGKVPSTRCKERFLLFVERHVVFPSLV